MPEWETDSAGLSADADIPLTAEHIEWATHIAVMEKRQLARLRKLFPTLVSGRRIASLDIPDSYAFMEPELIELLKQRIVRVI